MAFGKMAKPFLVRGASSSGSVDQAHQLSFFPELEGEVMLLRKHLVDVRTSAKPVNTCLAWRSDWLSFEVFCLCFGMPSLPASTDTVLLYCAAELKAGHRVSTIRRRLWSIRGHHVDAGMVDPVTLDVSILLSSASRSFKERPPRQAEALTVENLRKMCVFLRKQDDDHPTGQSGRDRVLLLIGFGAALRASEAVGLQFGDVTLSKEGLAVRIRQSKADQEGKGATVRIFAGKYWATNVVEAWKRWITQRGKAEGSLFGISDDCYRDVIKRSAVAIGLDGSLYSGHSLRSGAITAAIQGGADAFVVMRELSRHRDMKSFQGYVRTGGAWKINTLAGLL